MAFKSRWKRATGICAIALVTLTVAPAAAKKKPEAPYPYGPAPAWDRYKEIGEQAVRALLKDPGSAVFDWPNGYRQSGFTPFLSKRKFGYATCGYVNARNSFGGYVGSTVFAVVIDYNQLVYVELGTVGGGMISDACRKADFPPAAEMPSVEGPPPPAKFGFTIMMADEGAVVDELEPGGLAEKVGLERGIVISHLKGIALRGLSRESVEQMIATAGDIGKFTLVDGSIVTIDKSAPH